MLMSRICYQARVALDAIREFLSGHVPPEKGVMLQWLMLALGTPAAASFIVQHAALLLAVHREADARTHAVQAGLLESLSSAGLDREEKMRLRALLEQLWGQSCAGAGAEFK